MAISTVLFDVYDHRFHKNHIYPHGITCNACPRAVGFLSTKEIFFYRILELNFTKSLPSNFIGYIWGKARGGGGLASPPITFNS